MITQCRALDTASIAGVITQHTLLSLWKGTFNLAGEFQFMKLLLIQLCGNYYCEVNVVKGVGTTKQS